MLSLLSPMLLVLLMSALRAGGQEEVVEVVEIDGSRWQQAYNENEKIIVLFYTETGCEACPSVLEKMNQILGQPEIPSGVQIFKSSDTSLATKLGIKVFPSLYFLRDKSHALYDGNFDVEDLLIWAQQASTKALHTLKDDSFEHLTQASTGSTTGDWLVAFYKDSCAEVLTALESLGVRLKGRLNVAKVKVQENPMLTERFKVTECPEIILFKQGKMYKYQLPSLDVTSLKSFVEGFYKNLKAHSVPVPKSQFDYLTEGIADYLKAQLDGENRNLVLAGICGVSVTLLLVFVCCCRSGGSGGKKRKHKKE